MDSTRQKKISRLIQKELADIFLKEGKIFSQGTIITVTIVRISTDFSIARVYLSIFPSKNSEEILNNIKKSSKQIRYDLGKRTRTQLRYIPELIFFIDDSLDYAEKIDKLLDK